MKTHAISLFFLLSVLPLNAMDIGNRRPRDEEGEASLKQHRYDFSAENRAPEGTHPCPFGEQSEELQKWKFVIPLKGLSGGIKNCSNGKLYQLRVDPQFQNFFSHAKGVTGAAVIQDGRIEILYMKVFPRNGFEESMEIDDVRGAGSWLTLGNMIYATQHQTPQDGQKPID